MSSRYSSSPLPADLCRRGGRAPTSTCSCRAGGSARTHCAAIPTTPRSTRSPYCARWTVGASAEIHDTALVGRTIGVRGPRNHFELEPAGCSVPRGRHWHYSDSGHGAQGRGAGNAVVLVLRRPRSLARMAFADELSRLGSDRVHLVPQDRYGFLALTDIVNAAPSDVHVYACGPEPMLRAAEAACTSASPATRLRTERFAARTSSPTVARPSLSAPPPSGPLKAVTASNRSPFEVELRRSGVTITVPAGTTLLDAIRKVQPRVPFSCEEGYCGTCETRVLEGEPEHNDDILSEVERASNSTIMVCVGWSRSARLVLDL